MWHELAIAVVLEWYRMHYEKLGFRDAMGAAYSAANFAWGLHHGKYPQWR